MDQKVEATLETRISQTTGKTYTAIVIKISDNYEKLVFLTKSELELLKLTQNKK